MLKGPLLHLFLLEDLDYRLQYENPLLFFTMHWTQGMAAMEFILSEAQDFPTMSLASQHLLLSFIYRVS